MADSRRNKASKKAKDFDPTRWTHVVFAVGAALLVWLFIHFVTDVWAVLWAAYPASIGRVNDNYAAAIGSLVGLGVGAFLWSRSKNFNFVNEVVIEVSQVIWPTRAETRAATIVVVAITFICAGLLWLMDSFWAVTTDWLYAL